MKNFTKTVIRNYAKIFIYLTFFGACLFLPAGQADWLMGWVYLLINAVSMIINSVILQILHPKLFVDRVNAKTKKGWDRALAGIMTFIGPISICIVSGFSVRNQWTPQMPIYFQILGILLIVFDCAVSAWAIASNKFFFGFIRIAKEESHSVCDKGAYQIVRHPGYLGAFLVTLATPLLLNSVWAFIPAIVTVIAIISRTSLEDKFLIENLDGYLDYTRKVRFRLIPPIW